MGDQGQLLNCDSKSLDCWGDMLRGMMSLHLSIRDSDLAVIYFRISWRRRTPSSQSPFRSQKAP